MVNRQIKGKGKISPVVEVPEINENLVKVISLRVPDSLHNQAKLCADAYGIPVNGLVCVALAEFLTEKGYRVHPPASVKRS